MANKFIFILDFLVTALVFYKAFTLIKETRAIQLLKGVLVLFIISFISQKLGFQIFNSLLEQIRTVVLIALPVVFQPELRRALEQIGRGKLLNYWSSDREIKIDVDRLVTTTIRLSKDKIGGLIVLKRETGLRDIIETGVKLDAILSTELLINLFFPKSPLHDGAVIIEGNKILAANCLLPLSNNKKLKQGFGTRHRAALGMSEVSDCVVIVVSEETGTISMFYNGKLKYNLDEFDLKEELFKNFTPKE